MTLTTPQALAERRDSWHRVAEHVLAAGQFAAEGTIRLRPHPRGIVTARGVAGRHLAVLGDQLVVLEPDGRRRSTRLTTIGDATAFAGVEPGLRGTYRPATAPDPDAPLAVDLEGRGGWPPGTPSGTQRCAVSPRSSVIRNNRCCGRSTSTSASPSTR
jgi:hypothetical protein